MNLSSKDKNQDGQVDTEEFLEWVFSGAQHSEKLLAETTPPAEVAPEVAPAEVASADVVCLGRRFSRPHVSLARRCSKVFEGHPGCLS